jgi:hypothetical protein
MAAGGIVAQNLYYYHETNPRPRATTAPDDHDHGDTQHG